MSLSAAPRAGFTLIELLIVVAIIGVLAAIAVPNFLEAQTRARTARAVTDLRTLATALEAYRVDEGDYPYILDLNGVEWQMPAGFPPQRADGPAGLTTPIAYLSAALHDPFVPEAERENPKAADERAPEGRPLLRYERLGFGFDGNGHMWNSDGRGVRAVRVCADGHGTLLGTAPDINTTDPSLVPTRYVLYSVGPSRSHRVYNDDGTVLVRSRFSIYNRYDPTNGTISQGCVLRFPGGMSFP